MNKKLYENLMRIADAVQRSEPLSNNDRHIIVFALGVYLGALSREGEGR